MKTLQNYFTFNRMQNTSKDPGKNEIASIISGKNPIQMIDESYDAKGAFVMDEKDDFTYT
jgi:hypothetical protein